MPITITPMLVARLVAVPATTVRYGASASEERRTLPVFSYLVELADDLVLFDLGCEQPGEQTGTGRPPVIDHRSPRQAVIDAGHDPDDVSTIVLSHLHWDHSAGIEGFPNARVLVQRDELRFAFAPDPEQWRPYDSWELGRRPAWMAHLPQIEALDGYHRLGDSLKVVPTPGHTPGSQSLLVRADRPYLLCGDLYAGHENWPGITVPGRRLEIAQPPGIHHDLRAWRASMNLVVEHDWLPLPAHDERVTSVVPDHDPTSLRSQLDG